VLKAVMLSVRHGNDAPEIVMRHSLLGTKREIR
jgi:hypothetical protein